MAAYAALCSLLHIIDQIQNHPYPPILLDKTQVESLTENVTFLQGFLEDYSQAAGYKKEADPLESRSADAAHKAEDVIESRIVDQIHSGSTSGGVELSSVDFYEGLQRVIGDMDSIKKDMMEIKDKKEVQDQQQRNSITSADSSSPSSTRQNTMVGFDDALLEILDKLTGGNPDRQVIPIVGMGGMGKTTLTRNVYVNPLIQQYFDICAWTTISQEYDTREILRELFCQVNKEETRDMSENELGEKLYKHLSGRRYLIVMDDMWNIGSWDEVRRFFPNYNNGSRIVITTRLSNLTSQLTGSYYMEMKFLDEHTSWNLLCKTVFGEEGCPFELEEIGKKIAENCRGLPLSIVVTGGLLVKSKHSREYWEYIAENLNSLVNSEDNERCLNILYLSYMELPVHLKPCFLYMGVFSEDSVIGCTMLLRLWVAEGFLKSISGKSLEEIAEECLEELSNRNLVRASRRFGKIKHCSIHDLLRDLCLREAQKQRFYKVMKEHSLNDLKGINTQRRIVIPEGSFGKKVLYHLQFMSLARSLILKDGVNYILQSRNYRLLRILDTFKEKLRYPSQGCSMEDVFHSVNSRYLAIHVPDLSKFPSSVCFLWNLQTLIVSTRWITWAPPEIWMMRQLRHVKFVGHLVLPNPPRHNIDRKDDDIVLSNLQSLSTIDEFNCSDEVIKRISNVKKLKLLYYNNGDVISPYFQNNLHRFHKLESFWCESKNPNVMRMLCFPRSIRKLSLCGADAPWDEMMEKIGSLPLLEVLKLKGGPFKCPVWETVEGQFSRLKYLRLSFWHYLEYWNSESTHFPRLEQLVLLRLPLLKEIPSGIGEIPTLQSIELIECNYFAVISATKIIEEQEELGDVVVQVRVLASRYNSSEQNEDLQSLASPNFEVKYDYNDWRWTL